MFVLWGFKHFGKSFFLASFRYNRKTVVQMQIGGEYSTHKWEYHGVEQHYKTFYRENDDNIIKCRTKIHELTSDELLLYNLDKGIISPDGVNDDYLGYGKFQFNKPKVDTSVDKKTGKKLYPIYSDHGSKWSDHFFDDLCTCDLFVPRPHNSMWYEPFIEHFRKCNNIVTYKEDVLDMCISRLNLFETKETNKYMNTNVKDIEDAYNTNKSLVFTHLDFFIKKNRDVEVKLRENNIPYEYLELDSFDAKRMVDTELPRRYNDVLLPIPKDTYRFRLITRMAKEYIKSRGLTDLRLSGRVNDKI
tara:strand:+ start:338 stop:1246 length:909 start_codon:yes stop_codon:yes gene_type:complete